MITSETRRRMSVSAKARCTAEWRRAQSLSRRTDVCPDTVRCLYGFGHTQAEIGEALGVSQKVIYGLMRREGIPRRKAAKRDQWAEKNHMWKGDSASLGKLHRRLDRRFGTPMRCEVCGSTDTSRVYEWANLSGRYERLDDYKRMCRNCHRRYDNARRKKK